MSLENFRRIERSFTPPHSLIDLTHFKIQSSWWLLKTYLYFHSSDISYLHMCLSLISNKASGDSSKKNFSFLK